MVREITDELTSLVKKLDKAVESNKGDKMAAFVVVLSDDPDEAEAKLKKIAEKEKIKNVPLTVFEGASGPKNYKISKDADVTVMMWVKHKVKVNHAFAKGSLKEKQIEQVVADVKKILPEKKA